MENRISDILTWTARIIFAKLLLISVATSTLSCESTHAKTTSVNFLPTEMLLEESHW